MSTTTNIKCAVDYYRDIKDIVSEAIAENPDDIDAQIEFIYESIEWSEWLVYTSNHGLIMKYSRSMGEIDAAEIAEQLTHSNGECGDYFKVRQLWAAQAMKYDVITEHQTQLHTRNYIQVCDDCLNIAYDMGIEPETQAAVMVKMGAVLDDHICIKREDTGSHCDCDCNNR